MYSTNSIVMNALGVEKKSGDIIYPTNEVVENANNPKIKEMLNRIYLDIEKVHESCRKEDVDNPKVFYYILSAKEAIKSASKELER